MKITKPKLADTLTRMKAAISEPEDAVDLETRIRDMLVVAPDDSDMRRYARDLAERYRMVRAKFGEENAERDLGVMVNRFWRPGK